MYRVGQEMEPPMLDLQPWQYFDLIGGTSVYFAERSFHPVIANVLDSMEGQSQKLMIFSTSMDG